MATFNFEEEEKTTPEQPRFDFTEKAPAVPTFNFEEKQDTTSVTAPMTSETGAAFGMYPKAAATSKKLPVLPEQKPEPFTPRDFTALDKAIETITPKAKPSVTAPVTGEGGAAFGMVPKQKFGGRTTGITEEMAAKSPEVLAFAGEYLKTRLPNKPLARDPVQLMRDFKDFMQKDTADTVREYTWASNATPKQRELAVKAYDLADKMQVSMEEHMIKALKDPVNYIGLGVGWGVKQAAVRTTQTIAKAQIKAALATAVTEGVVSGGQNVLEQKTNIKLGLQKDFSYAATAASVGLGIAFEGAAVSQATKAVGGQKLVKERLADLREARATTKDVDTDAWLEQFTAREKEVVNKPAPLYESPEARTQARKETLDTITPPTDTTEAVLSKPIINDIFNVAKQLFKDNPDLRPDLNEVRTVQGIVNALSAADEDVIQQAATRAGVKPADFLEAFKVQASEAGAFLQQAKSTADLLRKMTQGDPVLEDAFKKMLNAGSGTAYPTGTLIEKVKKGTGASVAASTAGLSTAVLNAIGAAGTMSIKAAGDTIESVYRVTGRMVNDLRGNGAPITATRVKEDLGEIFADGGYVLARMMDAGYTKELSELALKNNPRLNNLINNVGAEVDLNGAPELLQTINTFNRAVDGMVRSPIFLQSVRDRMKAVGLDFDDFIANDKPVPASLLKAAAEDTMKLTFSYNFKRTGEKGIEGTAENLAFDVLQLVNKNAGVGVLKDLALPFIRFNLNAMRYTYRMTPFSGLGGMQELKQAAKLREEGKFLEAAGLAYDGKRKVLDASVGAAAIGTAAYLMDEDIQFYQYRDKEGNVKDMSGLFPIVNIKALGAATRFMKDVGKSLWYTASMTPDERAEEANKIKAEADKLDANDPKRQQLINQYELLGLNRIRNFDGAKMIEIVTGMGRQAGVQKTVFEMVAQAVEGGITESMERKTGTAVGGFVSRFDNVLNPVYDLINFITDDNRVVDPRASTTSETLQKAGPFAEAAVASVVAPIPGARELLSDRPSLFQKTPQESPAIVRQFTGERATPPTTPIENEFARLNMPTYKAVSTSGDRDYDNIRIVMARNEFINNATRVINSKEYKQMSANNQQKELNAIVNQALKNTKDMAKDYFIAAKGEAALDALYEKARNREAQEDNFMQKFKRRPQTPLEKMMIIEGEFDTVGEISKL